MLAPVFSRKSYDAIASPPAPEQGECADTGTGGGGGRFVHLQSTMVAETEP